MNAQLERRPISTREVLVAWLLMALGLCLLVLAVLVPSRGAMAVLGIFATVFGLGSVIYGVSRLRSSAKARRLRREAAIVQPTPGRRSSGPWAAARPEMWDPDGLARVDPRGGAARRTPGP